MSRERAAAGTRGHALHHAPLVALLAAGAVFSLVVLVEIVGQRSWLSEKWGGRWWGHALALGAGALACAAVLALRVRAWRAGTWTSRSLAPFRGLFVVWMAASAVYLFWMQPFRQLSLGIAMAHGIGAWALLFGVLPPLCRSLPRGVVRGVDFALFNLCLLAVLLEGGLRVRAHLDPSMLFDQRSITAERWVRTFRCPPGSAHLGTPCNREGHYDTDAALDGADGPLVVTIGDSFSLSIVPLPHHFTTVAESRLPGVEFYNMGIAGAGPPEYLWLLRAQALDLEPDLIVVNLFVGNDVRCPGQLPDEVRDQPLRRLYDLDNLLLYNVPVRLARLRREQRAFGDDGRVVGTLGEGRNPFTQVWDTEEKTLEQMPWLADPMLEKATISDGGFRRIEMRRLIDGCRPFSDYRGLFATLEATIAAAGDTPLAFMLIPDEFQVEERVWEMLRGRRPKQDFDRFRPQREIGAWAAERGIPVLDLLPILRAQEPLADGHLHLYHFQDTHLNVRGNEVVGRALAEFVSGLIETGD